MKMLKLERQKHNEPRFDELYQMLSDLEAFLDEDADRNDGNWSENLSAILDFQDTDGSFRLFDSYRIPGDARVDFCYIPTYLCCAVLMKALMSDSEVFTSHEKSALSKGLEMSCARNLRGHGYEALKGQIEAVKIFMKAGLNEFMELYPEICPQFSEMIERIITDYADMVAKGNFRGPWGESYEAEIRQINEYFGRRRVFVYGTLMRGEANHDFLKNAEYLGRCAVKGYDMYDVGSYPAIVPGESLIPGELYHVSKEDMASIDMLEGEGNLYSKRCERININGKADFAFVYVYMRDVSDLRKIPAWNEEYVWYVSYGSNMLEERFRCYLEGGSYEKSTYREPCDDPSLPAAIKTVEIPFDMYFGNVSGSWQGGGVSFLDTTGMGKSLGVAYLITRNQLKHVAAQENGRIPPEESNGWYTDYIDLGQMNGFKVITITNREPRTPNEPSPVYRDVLVRGIKENWPAMSDDEIEEYINGCCRF